MATDTGTVELPSETTDESLLAGTESAINRLMGGDDPETPQKPEEQETVPEGEPPQETETTPETESEAPPAAVDDETLTDDGIPPDTQERINKQFDRLTAKRREAEEALQAANTELDSLKAKVKELTEVSKEPQQQLPPDADPLLRHPDIKKLWDHEQKVKAAKDEALQLLRFASKSPDAAFEQISKTFAKQGFENIEQAKDWLQLVKDDATAQIHELQTKRNIASYGHVQKLEKEAEKFHDLAIKAYPDALDPKSKMGQRVAQLTKRMPALLDPKVVTDGWQILTDLAAGQLLREGKVSAPAVPAKPPQKLTTTARVAPATRPVNGKPSSVLKAKAVEEPTRENVAKFFEAII